MTPAEILPTLTPDEIAILAEWIGRMPVKCLLTDEISNLRPHLSAFLYKLADLRRQA